MFRSVDGCASSSGRRRDAEQEKTKKDYTRIESGRREKRHVLFAYKTSAKPPKKAPARARKPKVCPMFNGDALPTPESAAAELAELSSAELLSPVADAPPKPE